MRNEANSIEALLETVLESTRHNGPRPAWLVALRGGGMGRTVRLGGTLCELHRDRIVGVHGRQLFLGPSLPAEERLDTGEQKTVPRAVASLRPSLPPMDSGLPVTTASAVYP